MIYVDIFMGFQFLFFFFSKHPLTFLRARLSTYTVISCGRWSAQKSSSSSSSSS